MHIQLSIRAGRLSADCICVCRGWDWIVDPEVPVRGDWVMPILLGDLRVVFGGGVR